MCGRKNAVQAAAMLRGRKSPGLTLLVADEVVVDAAGERIPAGIDGESVQLVTPVRSRVRRGALRVRVPRDRPGVPAAAPAPRLSTLLRLAAPSWMAERPFVM